MLWKIIKDILEIAGSDITAIEQELISNLKNDGLHSLNQIYEEIGHGLWSVVELYRQVKAENMNIQHVIRLLKIANSDIPSIEYKCRDVEREEDTLRVRNKDASRIYQQFIDQISRLKKRKEECVAARVEQQLEVARLQVRK